MNTLNQGADLLLTDVTVVNPENEPLTGQDLFIADGLIQAMGPTGTLNTSHGCTRIPGDGGLCIPGLVNTHNHTPLTIVRGMVEDVGFAPAYTPGIPQGHWLSAEETYLLARLGLLELLRAGCAVVVDYYRCPDALARAAAELGIRAFIGGRIMDVDNAALADGRFEVDAVLGEQTLRDSMDLIAQWDGANNGQITAIHAPHAPDTCSPGLLKQVAELAHADGRQVHTHLAQSTLECEHVKARDGQRPSEVLDQAGLLNERLFAAHCIFLEEDEIARVGAAGTVVCHAAVGNAAFGAMAPIRALADAGATITLCTDTKTADMFETMRMALAAARIRAGGGFEFDAATVLRFATENGARALFGDAASGRLEAGARADITVLEASALNLFPVVDGQGIVVHSASGGNVRHVVSGGHWLLADGQPTRANANDILNAARGVAERLWRRARSV